MPEGCGEFCYIIDLEHIINNQGEYTIKASPAQCEALSKRFGIKSIQSLSVDIKVFQDEIDNVGYFVTGVLNAEITQKSIVSLQDVHEKIHTTFDVRVFDKNYQKNILEEQENEQDIEFCDDEKIDIGEIAAQYFALEINPYPRLENESFNADEYADPLDGPFAKLQEIRDKS